MAAAKKLYYENVRVGDELPPLTMPVTDRVTIARYAGASDDYNPVHVDEEYAKRCGFPGTFAHPMLAMGYLGHFAGEWLRGGQVKRLSSRFVKIIWPGDQLTCRGRIVDRRREGGDYYLDIELWVENQRGELVVKGSATARLYHSPEDEDRQRRGLPALIVEDAPRPTLAEVFERELPRVSAVHVQPAAPARTRGKPAPKATPRAKTPARKPAAARKAKR